MAEVLVRGTPANPAFALGCLGLMGISAAMGCPSEGRFDLKKGGFRWNIPGDPDAVLEALGDIKWEPFAAGLTTVSGYPLVLHLHGLDSPLTLDWWVDWTRQEKNSWGMWAGRVRPGTIMDKLVAGTQAGGRPRIEDAFETAAAVDSGSLFGFDSRFVWNALDLGFSINDLRNAQVVIWPWAELLAAIGMQVLSPPGHRHKMQPFRYTVWHQGNLPLPLARLVMLGEQWLGLGETTTYLARLVRNGSSRKLQQGHPWQSDREEGEISDPVTQNDEGGDPDDD